MPRPKTTTLPRIETPRLVLTLPPTSAAHRVIDYFTANREHLERWDPPRAERFYTEAFWRRQLTAGRQDFADGRALRLFMNLREDEVIVGTVVFSNFVRGPFLGCNLGYGIHHQFEGRGLMAEALRAAIPYVFEQMGLHRVMANYRPTNERSARLLRRLGFVVEGYAREFLFIDGAWRDHVLTALTNPDEVRPVPA